MRSLSSKFVCVFIRIHVNVRQHANAAPVACCWYDEQHHQLALAFSVCVFQPRYGTISSCLNIIISTQAVLPCATRFCCCCFLLAAWLAWCLRDCRILIAYLYICSSARGVSLNLCYALYVADAECSLWVLRCFAKVRGGGLCGAYLCESVLKL